LTTFPVSHICKKYRAAVAEAQQSKDYFEELTDRADPASVKEWEKQMATAQKNRLKNANSMDILDAQVECGSSIPRGYLICNVSNGLF
jgi:hypothetical protein